MVEQTGSSSDSSARTETVKSYVTEATKADLDREAKRQGMSRSGLIERYIQEGLRRDREDDLAAETRAVQRLQHVLDRGLDDMRDTARQIQDINAQAGVYSIALFELLKDDYGEAEIREAFQNGAKRLQEDDFPGDGS